MKVLLKVLGDTFAAAILIHFTERDAMCGVYIVHMHLTLFIFRLLVFSLPLITVVIPRYVSSLLDKSWQAA